MVYALCVKLCQHDFTTIMTAFVEVFKGQGNLKTQKWEQNHDHDTFLSNLFFYIDMLPSVLQTGFNPHEILMLYLETYTVISVRLWNFKDGGS